MAKGRKNGPLDISSRDNLWYAKNRDISLRFQSFYIFEKITKKPSTTREAEKSQK